MVLITIMFSMQNASKFKILKHINPAQCWLYSGDVHAHPGEDRIWTCQQSLTKVRNMLPMFEKPYSIYFRMIKHVHIHLHRNTNANIQNTKRTGIEIDMDIAQMHIERSALFTPNIDKLPQHQLKRTVRTTDYGFQVEKRTTPYHFWLHKLYQYRSS